MENVLDCVFPYIRDGNDLSSISLVSRRFYDLDRLTRKHLTLHVHYAPSLSRLNQRFPCINSLTLQGDPSEMDFSLISGIDVTPLIQELGVLFDSLISLCIRRLPLHDSDLELLAKTRGKDLRSLEISGCQGISDNGLMSVSEYCDKLTSLSVDSRAGRHAVQDGKWLRELASRNTQIETFSLLNLDLFARLDLAPLLKSCSKSLVSLRFEHCRMDVIGNDLSGVVNLERFSVADFEEQVEYDDSFKFPPGMRCLGIYMFSETSYPFVLPLLNQLRELELGLLDISHPLQRSCLEMCPDLEVLYTKSVFVDPLEDVSADFGLIFVSLHLKKLRKLTFNFEASTPVGLIAVAQGCPNLEYLHVELSDISNEALEFIGSHLKNLCDFDMRVYKNEKKIATDLHLPLDNGVRAMLMGCTKLERLGIHLDSWRSKGEKKGIHLFKHCLTDVGLRFIGKSGVNLRFLSLTRVGDSDYGLLALSDGCPNLIKLDIRDCPFGKIAVTNFVFDMPSLRYVWGTNLEGMPKFLLTRPTFEASTMKA